MTAARVLLHGLFIYVGVATTMLGPLLPSLMRRWELSDSLAGSLFTAQFLFSVASSISVLMLMRRYRTWRLMGVGYLLCGIGAMGLAASDWKLGFAGTCVYGLGLGLVNPTANLSAAALMPGRAAAALNLLNFFFSIGATFAPPVIGFFVDEGWSRWFPLFVSLPVIAGAAASTRMSVPEYSPEVPSSSAPREGPQTGRRFRFAILCMALLFVYVGVEVAMGGWTSTYMLRVAGASPVLAASAPAALWGAVLVSRITTVLLLRYFGTVSILAAAIVLALAGSVLMLWLPSPATVIASIALAGVGLGPIFANGLGYFLEHYGKGANRLTGLLFAAGGVGGGLLPLLIGRISDLTGDLRLALWCIAISAVVMLLILAAAARSRPDRNLRRT